MPSPIDYQSPPREKDRSSRGGIALVCIIVGVTITPFAIILAIASAGAGHGHYELARLLFPYTMLLTLLTNNRIAEPWIVLAFAQFPLYGLILAAAAWHRGQTFWLMLLVLGAAHAVAAMACFSGWIPNFS